MKYNIKKFANLEVLVAFANDNKVSIVSVIPTLIDNRIPAYTLIYHFQ